MAQGSGNERTDPPAPPVFGPLPLLHLDIRGNPTFLKHRGVLIPHEWLEAENIARKKVENLENHPFFFCSLVDAPFLEKGETSTPTYDFWGVPVLCFPFSGANC